MTTQFSRDRAAQSPGLRIPMGPFPARLDLENPHVVLEVIVGQVTDSAGVENAWLRAGDVLRGMYGPAISSPGLSHDPRSGAVTITYAAPVDADGDEIQEQLMAGSLYAAFMAVFLEASLTPEWNERLRRARVLGPQMADPRHLVGTTTAHWDAWTELAESA